MTKQIPHRLVSYNLSEILQEVIDLAKKGYTLNTENKFYPEHFMGRTVIHMDAPAGAEPSVEVVSQTAPEGFGEPEDSPAPQSQESAPETLSAPVEERPIHRAGPGRGHKKHR